MDIYKINKASAVKSLVTYYLQSYSDIQLFIMLDHAH